MERDELFARCSRLCGAFSRSHNFPQEETAFIALVNGLMRASKITGISPSDIVEECLQISKFCPTDFDLLSVARDMAGPARVGSEIGKDDESDKRAYQSVWQAVPVRQDGSPDYVEWTANCIKLAIMSNDFRPLPNDPDSVWFWAESARDYELSHPRSVAAIRAGGEADRDEVKAVLAARTLIGKKRKTA